MMDYIILVISIRLLIVTIGVMLTWKTITISRASSDNKIAYWFLSLGFFIFKIAQKIEGILFEFTDLDIVWIHVIEGVLSSISFILIISSIYRFYAEELN